MILVQQWTKDSLPGPEGNEETEPGECEDASVDIDGVQSRDGTSLAVDGIYHGVLPQNGRADHLEAHERMQLSRKQINKFNRNRSKERSMLFEQCLRAGSQTRFLYTREELVDRSGASQGR